MKSNHINQLSIKSEDVVGRPKCWECNDSQWNINHLNHQMTSKHVRKATDNTNGIGKTRMWIACSSTADVWQRPKCWQFNDSHWKINDFDELMSKNIRNAQNCINTHKLINLNHLLINCWRSKHPTWWKFKGSQWNIHNLNQLMSLKKRVKCAKRKQIVQNIYEMNHDWSIDDAWTRPKYCRCEDSQWNTKHFN